MFQDSAVQHFLWNGCLIMNDGFEFQDFTVQHFSGTAMNADPGFRTPLFSISPERLFDHE